MRLKNGDSLQSIVDGAEYILEPGNYKISPKVIRKSLTLRAADSTRRPTIEFPDAWPEGKARPTLQCYGDCRFEDLNIKGGERVIAVESRSGGTLFAQDIHMDGGGFWRGWGGEDVRLYRVVSTGVPYAYMFSNFNEQVRNLVIDNRGVSTPIRQGKREAAIRLMNIDEGVLIGLKTIAHLNDGRPWKQDVQFRPTSNYFEVINCDFGIVDIGDIAIRTPPLKVKKVKFIDSRIKQAHKVPGAGEVIYVNTYVDGNLKGGGQTGNDEDDIKEEPLPPAPPPTGELNLFLVDSNTGEVITPLKGNMDLKWDELEQTSVSIAAMSEGQVKSVRFEYNGKTARIENSKPFSFLGDTNGVYNVWTPDAGVHAIEAIGFSDLNAKGSNIATASANVNVVKNVLDSMPEPDVTNKSSVDPSNSNPIFGNEEPEGGSNPSCSLDTRASGNSLDLILLAFTLLLSIRFRRTFHKNFNPLP